MEGIIPKQAHWDVTSTGGGFGVISQASPRSLELGQVSLWEMFALPFVFGSWGSAPWQCQVPLGLRSSPQWALGSQGRAGATGKQPGAAALRQEAVRLGLPP